MKHMENIRFLILCVRILYFGGVVLIQKNVFRVPDVGSSALFIFRLSYATDLSVTRVHDLQF